MYKKGEWWSGFTQKPESVEEKESNPKGGGLKGWRPPSSLPWLSSFNSLSYSGIQADFIDQVELSTISYASFSLLCSLLSQPESRNPFPLPRNVVKAHLSHLLLLPFPQFAHPLQVLRPSRSYETSFRLLSLELGSESDLSTRKKIKSLTTRPAPAGTFPNDWPLVTPFLLLPPQQSQDIQQLDLPNLQLSPRPRNFLLGRKDASRRLNSLISLLPLPPSLPDIFHSAQTKHTKPIHLRLLSRLVPLLAS